MNSDQLIEFDNTPPELKTILYDLVSMSLGLRAPSQALGVPSAVSCYPSVFQQSVMVFNSQAGEWERVLLTIYNNQVYLFRSMGADKPLGHFGFKEMKLKRTFVDAQLYDVKYEAIKEALLQQ